MEFVFCALLGVAVQGCDPAAAQYEQAARIIPAPHWALVKEVGIDPLNRGKAIPQAGLILLPAEPYLYGPEVILAHEVGHLVVRRPEFWASWWNTHGQVPCSAYAQSHAGAAQRADEAFADSYAQFVTGIDLGCADAAAWIKRELL